MILNIYYIHCASNDKDKLNMHLPCSQRHGIYSFSYIFIYFYKYIYYQLVTISENLTVKSQM